jgi:hypothetical protein
MQKSNLSRLIEGIWRLGSPLSPLPVFTLALLVVLYCLLSRGVYDVDIFWQILLGKITLESGLPGHEPLLAHQQNQPYVAFYWLGQILYSLMHRLGDWPLLRLVDALFWLGGFAIVGRQCARRHGNVWPAVIAMSIGIFGSIPFASLRLQNLGIFALGLLIVIIRSTLSMRLKLLLTLPLLLLWQNLHPSVIIAVVYLGLRALVAVVQRFREPSTESPWPLMSLAIAATATMFLTPVGTDIVRLSAYNGSISKHLGVTEWQSMWINYHFGGFWMGGFAMLISAGILYGARIAAPGSLTAADLVPFLAFTAMSIVCHRFIMQWGVFVVPVVADGIAGWIGHRNAETTRSVARISVVRGSIVMIASIPAIAWPLIDSPRKFESYFPFETVAAMKARPVRGVIFCDFFWGGVVSYEGWPDWKATHDGRYYLRPREYWDHYFDEIATGRISVSEIEADDQPAAWLLRKGGYDGLINLLRASPRWTVLHENDLSIAFVRSDG